MTKEQEIALINEFVRKLSASDSYSGEFYREQALEVIESIKNDIYPRASTFWETRQDCAALRAEAEKNSRDIITEAQRIADEKIASAEATAGRIRGTALKEIRLILDRFTPPDDSLPPN